MKEIINPAIVHCWILDIPVTVMNIQNVIKEHRGSLKGISRQQIASRIAVYETQGILGMMEDMLVKPDTEAAPETNPEPARPDGYDIVEASQANTTRDYQPGETFYVYASTSRPISGSWAQIPGAVYVNANNPSLK
jgi:hypothetical protein